MKQVLFFLLILILPLNSFAQKNDLKRENLINYNKIKFIGTNKNFGKVTVIEPFKKSNAQFEIETITLPQFIYKCATSLPIHKQSVKSGRVFLLSFSAKTTKSSLETGEAKINLLFKQSESYKNNIVSTQSISSKWQQYYIPFQSDINIDQKNLGIILHYGFKPQAFLIKDIKFELFSEGTKFEALPKTEIVYKGMEPDANWRKEANVRIEKNRKSDFKVQFLKKGKSISNKNIGIKLIKHDFPFGAAINAKDVVANNKKYKSFIKAFDLAVFENDLKIKSLQWKKKKDQLIKAISILKKDKVAIKGHVLIWPGFNYLTPEIKEYKDNPEKVNSLIEEHVSSLLKLTKNKISHWDVVNEAYTNRDLQKITGSEDILYNGFKATKEFQPLAKRFVNEYGIISKGGLDTKKQEWYYNFIKRIDENTANSLDGIGIQSHIGSDLTPPEKVLEILDYYGTLNKTISISEFTMDIQEPVIREQYTRDFMIAAFSHPKVSEFLFWGYVEDDRKKVDIYKKDFTVGAMGKAYFSLINDVWKTDFIGKTNEEGTILGNGFYGTYEYTFVDGSRVIKGTFQLNPNQYGTINVHLK